MRIDARGLLCPLPVLRLRKVLEDAAPGIEVRLIATDPMAVVDVPHFCQGAGHVMVAQRDLGDGAFEFTVRRGDPRPGNGGPTPSG
ncbi:sulfurtransferase TusA family protein [Paracoccus aestuarii]|uniref:Sulfurtransferase TusA family protein n=1 Tax=Paracoccus aestuarii TaxID=453842 RepID=A0A418ZWE7_9RHOB|nr:sulfurtransferase TusA family protein [Paracoccus aestuarii]RJL04812.1 sulfurtransferase TusA family protein [Paracoccus aestuarii]WCQ99372.1 sulfurtransferase TusA family protein [Paracoccus aestuarii]